ncbi:TriI protein [Fructobacillus tropaeoli]|uniref:TriI protein n=1 Tax=Fructobacillus tropaeoli TaxID=709323 RepID=A0A3F3H553_9LACO|nr:TriI protein [Fructobacillus tropaeoli]
MKKVIKTKNGKEITVEAQKTTKKEKRQFLIALSIVAIVVLIWRVFF